MSYQEQFTLWPPMPNNWSIVYQAALDAGEGESFSAGHRSPTARPAPDNLLSRRGTTGAAGPPEPSVVHRLGLGAAAGAAQWPVLVVPFGRSAFRHRDRRGAAQRCGDQLLPLVILLAAPLWPFSYRST